MSAKPMLTLREVVLSLPGGTTLGPFNWEIFPGSRVGVEVPGEGLAALLRDVLTGRVRPSAGYVEEIGQVVAQSDAFIRETLPLRHSIYDLLKAPDLPEFVWLENRRRPLPVVLELLGLTPAQTRAPLKHQPVEVVDKFWALRFVVSRAELLVGGEIFRVADAGVRRVLAMRWPDFPGAVVALAAAENLPGTVDTRVFLGPGGTLRVAAAGQPAPKGPGEGAKP